MVGRGVLVLNFAMRTEKVYHAEDSWREGVVQYSGFGVSGLSGYVVGAGTRAIGMSLMLSPAGWVVLIGAAVVVGFMASSFVDNQAQIRTGRIYDRVSGRL